MTPKITPKIHVAVLCGGQSAEHEISIRSARNIINAMDRNKYDITLITIDQQGKWHPGDIKQLTNDSDPAGIAYAPEQNTLALMPGQHTELFIDPKHQKSAPAVSENERDIDVVFPVLHGPYGEDGTVQGLLKLADVPFVGSDVLGSAISMDKDVMKRLLRDAGLPVAPFLVFRRADQKQINFKTISKQLGTPLFVKPANLGSSVGISKVRTAAEFATAIQTAFEYDNKLIIEAHVTGREIECSVLGNDHPIASLPGELMPNQNHEFYSYEAKYLDENAAIFAIPAKLEPAIIKSIQELSIKAFQVLCCSGMARADFFLTPDGQIFINELNTIPGFTNISMYPRLWQVSGISNVELIEQLITLALEKFDTDKRLKTSVKIPALVAAT
jgi:D-alanine-D-alanine ligase